MHKSRVPAVALYVEGAAGTAGGIGFVIAALVGHPHDRGTAVLLGALLAGYGAAVGYVGRGVDRRRPWAQTPAFLIQFFALVVAWGQRDTLPVVSAVLAILAVTAIVGLARAQGGRMPPGP